MAEYEVKIEATSIATTTMFVRAGSQAQAEEIAKDQCIGNAEWEWNFPTRHDITHAIANIAGRD